MSPVFLFKHGFWTFTGYRRHGQQKAVAGRVDEWFVTGFRGFLLFGFVFSLFSGNFSFPVFIEGCGFRTSQFHAMMIHKGFGLEFLIWFHPGWRKHSWLSEHSVGFLSASEKSVCMSSAHPWQVSCRFSIFFLPGLQRSSQASSSAAAFLHGNRCFARSLWFRVLATVQVMWIPWSNA